MKKLIVCLLTVLMCLSKITTEKNEYINHYPLQDNTEISKATFDLIEYESSFYKSENMKDMEKYLLNL